MSYSVFLLPSAHNDIVRAESFYDSISPGLGQYCIGTLLSDVDSLAFYAGIHPTYHGYFRLLSRRFPYAIYYKILDHEVPVSAILSTRQNPATHHSRLQAEHK